MRATKNKRMSEIKMKYIKTIEYLPEAIIKILKKDLLKGLKEERINRGEQGKKGGKIETTIPHEQNGFG